MKGSPDTVGSTPDGRRLPLVPYLVRVAAGIAWLLFLAAYGALLAYVAVGTALDFHVLNLLGLVMLVGAIGVPLYRHWTRDRGEVLSFFSRAVPDARSRRDDAGAA